MFVLQQYQELSVVIAGGKLHIVCSLCGWQYFAQRSHIAPDDDGPSDLSCPAFCAPGQ